MKEILVKADVLAAAFEVTKRQVLNYATEGMPRQKRGLYDFVKCVRWIRDHDLKQYEERLKNQDLEEQETRLKRAQAGIKELELAELQGILVRRTDVANVWERQISAAKVQLLSVPAKVAAIVLASKSLQEVQAILTTEIDHALDELSRTDIDTGAVLRSGTDEMAGDTSLESAKAAQPQPVGRRKTVHPGRGKSHGARKMAHVPG